MELVRGLSGGVGMTLRGRRCVFERKGKRAAVGLPSTIEIKKGVAWKNESAGAGQAAGGKRQEFDEMQDQKNANTLASLLRREGRAGRAIEEKKKEAPRRTNGTVTVDIRRASAGKKRTATLSPGLLEGEGREKGLVLMYAQGMFSGAKERSYMGKKDVTSRL